MGQLSIDSNGTLYGTTFGGGRRCGTSGGGCGVIFRLRKSGSKYEYGLIYRLRERQDGAVPSPGLALGKDGSLYGAAVFGGPQGCGTVFALKPNARRYTFTVLHAFACSGPSSPAGVPALDSGGAIYGTTVSGGNSGCASGTCGTVYALTPSSSGYAFSVVYAFRSHKDGTRPQAGVVIDGSGALYGTTLGGGAHNFGTVYNVRP